MKAKAQPRADELRAFLIGLFDGCPAGPCNPEDCPLHSLRKMPRSEQLQWFDVLDEDDLAHLAGYHYVCLNTKL